MPNMSKETHSENLRIKTTDTGVLLTSTNIDEKKEVFLTLEGALQKKDLKAYEMRTAGVAVVALGIAGMIGSLWLTHDTIKNAPEEYLASFPAYLSSYVTARVGVRIYSFGDLARRQWQKIKDDQESNSQAFADLSEESTLNG